MCPSSLVSVCRCWSVSTSLMLAALRAPHVDASGGEDPALVTAANCSPCWAPRTIKGTWQDRGCPGVAHGRTRGCCWTFASWPGSAICLPKTPLHAVVAIAATVKRVL